MKKIVLRTYDKLWKMPFKIYSIDNLRLIIPLCPWDVIVFSLSVFLMILISKILFFIKIPFVIKYIIVPWIVTKMAATVKLDGKKPYKYFFDMICFYFIPKEYEKFKAVKRDKLKGFKEEFIIRKNKRFKNPHKDFMENTNCIIGKSKK
ncbi:MAG: TcpE family conjugal transfer membrane protein [Clostridiales bacterium]